MNVFAECQTPLGMQNGAIQDSQIKASSEWDGNHAAIQGRLHFKAIPGKAGSWSARSNDMNQWLQIDLGNQHTKVTRIATQGRNAYNQWVTKYKLLFSDNGVNFHYYKEQGDQAIKVRQSLTTNRRLTILCKHDIQRTFHFIVAFLPLTYSTTVPKRKGNSGG